MKRAGLILLAIGWVLFVTGGAGPDLKPSVVNTIQQWIALPFGAYRSDVNLHWVWLGGVLIGAGMFLRRW